MQPLDAALLGALALPLFAAHNLADHPLQSSAWAAAKGQCDHEGRLACAKHVLVVVVLQAVAVLGVVALTDTAVSPLAVVRELQEETGVDLTDQTPSAILTRSYVADWRATDHAWVTSTAALYLLPDVLPAVAADDAADAKWFPFVSVAQLAEDLEAHGGLYEAHLPILTAAADHLG